MNAQSQETNRPSRRALVLSRLRLATAVVGAFAFALLFGLLNAGGTYAAAPEPTAVAQMGSLFTSNVDAGSIMTASAGLIAAAIAALLILVVAPSWGLGLARRFINLFR